VDNGGPVENDDPTLDEAMALLEATLESTHDAIIVVDRHRRVIRCNTHYLKMFGFTADELRRGGVDAIIEKLTPQVNDFPGLLDIVRPEPDDPDAERFDLMRFKDGRTFERYVAPHRIGRDIVGHVATFRDITRTVQTEQALEQHRAFLEKAQEVAHVGSWVSELDGSERLEWSKETHQIFGVPYGQFVGLVSAFLEFVHPDDRDAVQQAYAAAAAGAQRYSIEHRIVTADGRVRWVHERADLVCDVQGRAQRMIGTVQEITERRLLEEQVRQSQKMEAIGRLAGGVAHDLNNALTAIAGYAELALGEIATEHPAHADVQEIRRAAERATSVTRQLLAFSRKQILEPRVFQVANAVSSVARLLERLLGTDIVLNTSISDDPAASILADPGQIEQAIVNLAVNARDAMPDGGRLLLTTSVEDVDEAFARAHVPMPPGRYVVLGVSDTGHGIPPHAKSQIFEPFFTTKEIGKGTGLGLSMVYGTVKQSGGFIYVDTEVGRGTTFRLYFPPMTRPAAVATPAAVAAGTSVDTITVLIAEDEPAVRKLVASTLKNEGYHLLLAESAEEALRLAAAHPGRIDLLLTDAIMPGQSGIELANRLIADRPGLPVIVMSGYTEEMLDANGLTRALELVHKPFTPRELRQRIRDVLKR
jgi:two-component system cell cycle sensor histidine kinase/response regulator CckA